MIFLVLSGKMIFLFPENMILTLRQKMKYDLSQKNTWKYDIFFKCSEKIIFQKNRTGIWYLSLFRLITLTWIVKSDSDKRHLDRWYSKYHLSRCLLSESIFYYKYDLSCSIWKDVFFPENMIFFLWTENERWYFSRSTWKFDIFCIYVQVLQVRCYTSLPEKTKDDLLRKNAPKGDWHSRLIF